MVVEGGESFARAAASRSECGSGTEEELEVLDGELVLDPSEATETALAARTHEQTALEQARPASRALSWASHPVVQTTVAAATGFVAGAATLALLRRYGSRAARAAETWPARPPGSAGDEPAGGLEPLAIGHSTTYLVQIRQIIPRRP